MSAASAARLRVLGTLWLIVLASLVASLLTVPVASARDARPAPIGSDPFTVGRPYRGDFPDPERAPGRAGLLRLLHDDLGAEPARDDLA